MQLKIDQLKQSFYSQNCDYDGTWLRDWRDWVIIGVFFLAIYTFFHHATFLLDNYRLEFGFTLILWVHLIFRFGINRKFYSYADRFPLYSCNLSAIILALNGLLKGLTLPALWESVVVWAVFAGLYGGFLAIVFSAPSAYKYPHITHFDHYVGHSAIFFLAAVYILKNSDLLTLHTLRDTSLITLIYLAIVNQINPIVNGNFGMLGKPPREIKFVADYLSMRTYKIICVFLYLVMNSLTWFLSQRLS